MDTKGSFKKTRLGYVYVVFAALMWGLSGSSAKFLFNSGITPFQLVQLRLTISAALLFLCLLVRFSSLLRIDYKDIFYFILFGTVGMAGVQFTYLFAISKIKVAAAILLQYLALLRVQVNGPEVYLHQTEIYTGFQTIQLLY